MNDTNTENQEDIATAPNEAADLPSSFYPLIPSDIAEKFEFFSYKNAYTILHYQHPDELSDIFHSLRHLQITTEIIRMPGGNESPIPKMISSTLRPLRWHETKIEGDLTIRLSWAESNDNKTNFRSQLTSTYTNRNYIAGHKIDYVKNAVAFDLEWNSKDQTFDRDLYAFSTFFACNAISCAVLVTRSEALDESIKTLGPALDKQGNETKNTTKQKYGASTTWMGKLLYRLNTGRNGGCPVLAIGIKPTAVTDLPKE